MFGELYKLFGRDFAITYFVPSAGFLAATYFISARFQFAPPLFALSEQSLLRDLTAFGLTALFWAIVLSALNDLIIRSMKGYWPLNLGQYLNWIEKWRYRRLLKQEEQSNKERGEYEASEFPRRLQNKRNRIKQRKTLRFPAKEHLILPTSFGNTFRAFENYARTLYGIDPTPSWYRLLAVVPQDYRVLMDAARARVDLWVNVSFLAALVVIEFTGLAVWAKRTRNLWPSAKLSWFPFLAVVLAYIAYRLAISAAAEWGQWVKSAFDLYLPELRRKLEFTKPNTSEEERAMWDRFSKAIIYGEARLLPERKGTSSEEKSKDNDRP
jgi:hypothetical protein